MPQEVAAMKRFQSIGLGLLVAAMGGLEVLTTAALAQAPASPPANTPSGTAGALVLVGLIVALVVALGIAVRLYDLQRRREQRAMELQARLSDAFLLEPSMSDMAITPTVHAPFWPRGPLTIELAGTLPTPEMRDAAIELVRRETSGVAQELRIEDRMTVNRRVARRVA
jgi:hypothetical protein